MAHNFPDVSVRGGNYPPPPSAVMIAKAAGYLQLAGMAVLFFGQTLASAVGITLSEQTVQFMNENKLMLIGMLFMFNTFAQNGMATGAFEVEVNGKVIFSKLEMGRMPSFDELVGQLKSAGVHPGGDAFGNAAM